MKKELMDGNEAAAWGARLAKAEVIPVFPITPQTEIIETIAQWVADGEFNPEFVTMESEHSVMSAAVGASATGARVFTATSSQGLELMHEVLYIASGLRLPIVMANCSRSLSAPIALWPDHNDFLSMRDCAWLMFHAKDNQEVIDSTIMAYKIAEDKKVLLPAVVNMDGYILSYTQEPTEKPSQTMVNKFLPRYDPTHAYFKPGKPLIQGVAVLHGEDYTFFRQQAHKAALNALNVTKRVCREWKKLTGREYGLIEEYRMEDAELAIVAQGAVSTMAMNAVDTMRAKGEKIGLVRLRVVRPWPREEINKALGGMHGIAVLDKNIAPGLGGIMYPEIKASLYDITHGPVVSSFVAGLGGKFESEKMFERMITNLKKDIKKGRGRAWYA